MIIKNKILKDGNIKTVKRFSFFPVRLNDEELLWLEWYKATKRLNAWITSNRWETIKVERIKND